MKYLVIGDASSMHIYNFVKTFLLPKGYEVHLLTLSILPVREEYRRFYLENAVVLHSVAESYCIDPDKKNRFYRALNLFRKLWLMHGVPKVTVCHVQSVYKTSLMMVLINRRKFDKLILSYWGGDIEDRSPSVIKLRERCFRLADVITVTVEQTLLDFREIYSNRYDEKLIVSRFATKGLDCINQLSRSTTREECRKIYGIEPNKICITCGYSAYEAQHQDRCLQELMKLPDDLRSKLSVIVPMQYGRFDLTYIDRVKRQKEQCDFQCTILEEFVPFEMSAKLAIATDIYLHLRDTDAFSNALKEHVYAGSYVVTGSWLHYIELEQMHAPMTKINDFSELTETIQEILYTYKIPEGINTFDPIYEMYSTKSIKAQWETVLSRALQ